MKCPNSALDLNRKLPADKTNCLNAQAILLHDEKRDLINEILEIANSVLCLYYIIQLYYLDRG